MYAVPPGSTRSSAVGTWVCVPTTAVTRPSKYQPNAIFSDVASACISTKMILALISFKSWSATRKGSSRSEEHTSELQSLAYLVCRLLLEKKKTKKQRNQQ